MSAKGAVRAREATRDAPSRGQTKEEGGECAGEGRKPLRRSGVLDYATRVGMAKMEIPVLSRRPDRVCRERFFRRLGRIRTGRRLAPSLFALLRSRASATRRTARTAQRPGPAGDTLGSRRERSGRATAPRVRPAAIRRTRARRRRDHGLRADTASSASGSRPRNAASLGRKMGAGTRRRARDLDARGRHAPSLQDSSRGSVGKVVALARAVAPRVHSVHHRDADRPRPERR